MKNKYLLTLLLLLVFLLNHSIASAQIVANDDALPGSYSTGATYYSLYSNDTLNGIPFASNQVTQTTVSSTNPGIVMYFGNVSISAGVPNGTYTLVYQICETANPLNCDTATVTLTVCSIPNPVMTANPIVNCTDVPSANVTGLPAGPWTLSFRDGINPDIIIPGTGPTATVNLPPGNLHYRVIDAAGCSSSFLQAPYQAVFPGNGFIGSLSGTYQDLNNDGLINIGDAIFYQCVITNLLNCPINMDIFSGSQPVSFIGAPNTVVAPGATDNSITAFYFLTQADINIGNVFTWMGFQGTTNGGAPLYEKEFTTVDLNIPDGILLNTFMDDNNNGVQDGAELSFTGGTFQYEINNDGVVHHTYANDGSLIIYESNPSNIYNLTFTQGNSSCVYNIITNSYSNVSVASGSGITTYNFPIAPLVCNDPAVFLSLHRNFPTVNSYDIIHLYNLGSEIASGTLTYSTDSALTILSVSETGITATANGFTLNYSNLMPHEHREITVTLANPSIPVVNIGDPLIHSVSITSLLPDVNLLNNSMTNIEIFGTSYDPNAKSESHGGKIVQSQFSAQDYLTYTIYFENIGTANAFNVQVNDLLSGSLDEDSVRMINASHPYILDRIGNALSWKFNGINLPPATSNGSVGKGYMVFQVKPKPGYTVGDIIPNTANIYFDTNPVIVTNTVQTEFVNTLNVDDFDAANFVGYPNPVHGIFNIQMKSNAIIKSVVVTDILGKTMVSKTIDDSKAAIDLSPFSNGLYFVKINGGSGKAKTIKVLKQ